MQKLICSNCAGHDSLEKLVIGRHEEGQCEYCGEKNLVVGNNVLFDYILARVDENVATIDDLSHFEIGMLYECGSDEISVAPIDIVLAEWFDLGEKRYFDDLMASVPQHYFKNDRGQDEHFYDDDGNLEHNVIEERWNRFVIDVKHSHRFFNPNAREFLQSLFSFLLSAEGHLKPECIRVVPRGEELFRARTASSREDAGKMQDEPWSQFGPAPKEKVGNQRMTPSGIPALYCAFERETCLSEIRSITGDHVVSIALTPTNQLKLLDLTKLEDLNLPESTLLDAGYRELMHLHGFVRSLVKRMSRPKGRSDELIYLSTQVVFEYLRLTFAPQVHGLVFPSVQTGEKGTNVVFFPEFSMLSKEFFNPPDAMTIAFGDEQYFEKQANLACIAGSIRFHKIKAVVTEADEFDHIYRLYESDLDKLRLKL